MPSSQTASATPRDVQGALSRSHSEKIAAQTSRTQTSPASTAPQSSPVKQAQSAVAREEFEAPRVASNFIDEWYNDKPELFWAFTIGGYALVIFLAGILCTIILTK